MNTLDREYKGGAFHPQLKKGKVGGMVYMDGASIRFSSEALSFQLPLDGVEIKMGGTADRLVFFSHPAHPEQTIYSREIKILNNSQFKSQQVTHKQRKSIQLHRFKKRVLLFATCTLVLIGFSSAYMLKDLAVGIVAKNLPANFENSLGENFIRQHKASNVFIESTEVREQLNILVEPLISSIASERYDFKFYIVQDSSLNAFALPGGHIVLHTGLILGASQTEEILGVIAHEIAHVTRQHGVRKVLESAGMFIIVSGLFGDVSGIAAVFLSNGAFLLQQQFSRDFEQEADLLAVDYLSGAGIDPSGLYSFFEKLKEKETESTLGAVSEKLSILSTHPATSERMKSLQKEIDEKEDKSYKPIEFDLKKFQILLYETANDE